MFIKLKHIVCFSKLNFFNQTKTLFIYCWKSDSLGFKIPVRSYWNLHFTILNSEIYLNQIFQSNCSPGLACSLPISAFFHSIRAPALSPSGRRRCQWFHSFISWSWSSYIHHVLSVLMFQLARSSLWVGWYHHHFTPLHHLCSLWLDGTQLTDYGRMAGLWGKYQGNTVNQATNNHARSEGFSLGLFISFLTGLSKGGQDNL